MLYSQYVAAYLTDGAQKGLSRSTLKTWGSWLRRYNRFIGSAAELGDFNAYSVKRFLAQLAENENRPRTIRSALHAFRAFAVWLKEEGLVIDSPVHSIPFPKKDAAVRNLCTDEQMQDILAACDRVSSNPRRRALARAMLSILIFTGVRRQELLNIRVEDVNLNNRSILINQGKGGKSRVVYPTQDCLTAIREYLLLRGEFNTERRSGTAQPNYLFTVDRNRRAHHTSLRKLLEDVKTVAGYEGDRSILPHSIRHNYATRLLKNGADLKTIQATLGHAEPTTTFVYLHSSEQQARNASVLAGFEAPRQPTPDRNGAAPRPSAAWRAHKREGR